MSGTCKYCGESGSQEWLVEHAGKCKVMLHDYSPEKDEESDRSECQMQTLVMQCREHLDWLDNELFEWSKNPEQYVIEDEQDLKSRRAELLQIFKECKIPRNA